MGYNKKNKTDIFKFKSPCCFILNIFCKSGHELKLITSYPWSCSLLIYILRDGLKIIRFILFSHLT